MSYRREFGLFTSNGCLNVKKFPSNTQSGFGGHINRRQQPIIFRPTLSSKTERKTTLQRQSNPINGVIDRFTLFVIEETEENKELIKHLKGKTAKKYEHYDNGNQVIFSVILNNNILDDNKKMENVNAYISGHGLLKFKDVTDDFDKKILKNNKNKKIFDKSIVKEIMNPSTLSAKSGTGSPNSSLKKITSEREQEIDSEYIQNFYNALNEGKITILSNSPLFEGEEVEFSKITEYIKLKSPSETIKGESIEPKPYISNDSKIVTEEEDFDFFDINQPDQPPLQLQIVNTGGLDIGSVDKSNLEAQLEQAIQNNGVNQEEIANLQQQIADKEKQLEDLNKQKQEHEKQLTNKTKELEQAIQNNGANQKTIEELKEEINKQKKQLEEAVDTYSINQTEIKKLQDKIEQIEEEDKKNIKN